jgi:hypothetical protein
MTLTDEEFREEYKPLHVPSHFDPADTQENKMIFALAHIGEGTAEDVLAELQKLEKAPVSKQQEALTRETLKLLYKKGLLTGSELSGVVHYDLSKITRANTGDTDPDPLAPGLD